jgi:hypothetical protein
MNKLVLGLCGAIAFGLAAGPASAALPGNIVLEPTYSPATVVGHPEMIARFGVVPSKTAGAQFTGDIAGKPPCTSSELGLPSWTGSFVDGTRTYCYDMIGTTPSKTAGTTTLTSQVYAYKMTFSDGTVFDPTAIDTACDSVSPYTRLMDSPLYNASPISNGKVSLGNIQYEDAQSVGEWYKFVKKAKDYAINLVDTGNPTVISLTVPASKGSTTAISGLCSGKIGEVDINWLASQVSTTAWNVNQLSVVLLWNVFQTESGSCCVLGYHGSYSNSKNQNGVFSFTAMSNPGIFGGKTGVGITDIHATTHEFGEAINDPFGNNATPEWGHTGQVSGCQNNLEVGDPLTGTVYGAPGGGSGITLNGFTYHPQELVYFSWFTEASKYAKYGADDVFSMSGTFTKTAQLC